MGKQNRLRCARGALLAALLWGSLSTSGIAAPRKLGRIEDIEAGAANVASALQPLPAEAPLSAIVQLQGLTVPAPQTRGRASLPLSALPGTSVYTLNAQLKNLSTRWLVDTGASTSMVATPIVETLKLRGKPIPKKRLAFAVAGDECPNMDATLHQLPTLQLQGVRVEKLQGLQFTNTVIPAGLSGVLGMDVLSQFDLYLHPGKSELKLLPPTRLPAAAIAAAIPLEKKLGVMVAQLQINGQGPFRVLLDTAADSTFISEKVAAQLQLDPATSKPIQIRGFCGLENAVRSQLDSVTLHHHQRRNVDTIILSSSILKALEVDGILGQSFLRHYQQYWRFNSTSKPKAGGSLLLVPTSKNSAQGS